MPKTDELPKTSKSGILVNNWVNNKIVDSDEFDTDLEPEIVGKDFLIRHILCCYICGLLRMI